MGQCGKPWGSLKIVDGFSDLGSNVRFQQKIVEVGVSNGAVFRVSSHCCATGGSDCHSLAYDYTL